MLYLSGGIPSALDKDKKEKEQSEFTKKLLEKAGLPTDKEKSSDESDNKENITTEGI